MIKLEKNSWKKITLGDYERIGKINAREGDSDEQKQIAIISVLNGVDEDEIWNLTPYEVNLLRSQMLFMVKLEASQKGGPKKLKINNEDYTINYNVGKMTYAQFVDFNTYYQQNLKSDEGLAKVLSTLIIPKGKKYNDGYDVAEVVNLLHNHLNVQDAVDILFFFLLALNLSEEISQQYLVLMTKWRKMITRNKMEKTRMENLLRIIKASRKIQTLDGSISLKS